MNDATIAIIGTGNMGRSLIGGLIANGYPANKICGANIEQEPLSYIAEHWGVHTTHNNNEAVKQADVIVLAVKPQVMASVAKEIAPIIKEKKPLVISIAAGIPVKALESWLGTGAPIVRCMPNTPALVGCGASGLFANACVTASQKELAESIMRAVGVTVWVEHEQQIDAVTALSGSGPAYFLMVMEALEEAGTELGLPKDISQLLTVQTALGAARLALESSEGTAALRKHVTSPGGTTEQAIKVLEAGNLNKLFKEAVKAAQKRSLELAQLFEK